MPESETVLIIGGAGYIGSGLVEGLVRKGHEVTVLDRSLYGFNPLARVNMSLDFCGRDRFFISCAGAY